MTADVCTWEKTFDADTLGPGTPAGHYVCTRGWHATGCHVPQPVYEESDRGLVTQP